jgi:hypothetical protein
MATIQELYASKKALPFNEGGPDAAKVDSNLQIDKSPYSVGLGGGTPADPAGIGAVENDPNNPYQGNRYGVGMGKEIGTGYIEWPTFADGTARATWNDTKKYGASPRT